MSKKWVGWVKFVKQTKCLVVLPKLPLIMQLEEKYKGIINTLEQLDKANRMLAFHRDFDEPDNNAIQNFERLRANFLRQLAVLLKEYEVEMKLPVAA
jgi:hypothetical protein